MAGGKTTMAELMNLIQGSDEDSSVTPSTDHGQEDAGEGSGRGDGADQGQVESAGVLPETNPGAVNAEKEVPIEKEEPGSGDDDLQVVGNPKKRKLDAGKTHSVMEKSFDAGGFIESQLLPGTEEFFRDADLAGQVRWIYQSLLRAVAIEKKVEPVLGNVHALEGKLRNSQKDLTDLRSREESLKLKLAEQEKKAEEDAKEINRLVERDLSLMKDLNASCAETAAAEQKVKDLEEKLALAESSAKAARQEVLSLKKKNREIAKGAREAVKLTEEGIKD
ncbi:uncharacterized protein DS421_7g208420 [Arachis hypogaea]|nr:uncharacterized protein DS421_7g208420 [Arachis hypogaea]